MEKHSVELMAALMVHRMVVDLAGNSGIELAGKKAALRELKMVALLDTMSVATMAEKTEKTMVDMKAVAKERRMVDT